MSNKKNLWQLLTESQNDYNNVVKELNNYRNNIQPMSDEQANKFRHLAGSAAMTQIYGVRNTNALGIAKEVRDIIQKKGLSDTLFDLDNNKTGRYIGKQFPGVNRPSLYEYIFKKYVQ